MTIVLSVVFNQRKWGLENKAITRGILCFLSGTLIKDAYRGRFFYEIN